MKQILKILVFIVPICIFAFFYTYLSKDNSYPGADYRVFEIPSINLTELYKETELSNEDLSGNLLINVWASWCITCRVENGFLEKLSNSGVRIIGLNYKDDRSDAIDWLKKYRDPYELVIHDFNGSLALDMGVTGAPETFLISNGEADSSSSEDTFIVPSDCGSKFSPSLVLSARLLICVSLFGDVIDS